MNLCRLCSVFTSAFYNGHMDESVVAANELNKIDSSAIIISNKAANVVMSEKWLLRPLGQMCSQ